MKKWNMVIDVARCQDCNNCFLADKDEFVGNDWPPYSKAQPHHGQRWLNIGRKERGQFPLVGVAYLPLLCQHCDDAPCMKNSPAGTVYKREDGIVLIDPKKAKGHKEIVDACPYGVVYWNEDEQIPQKCTGCAHLMDEGWKETRCTQVCPTEAMRLVLADDGEMAKRASAENLETYLPHLGTRPRVYFKNLHLWTKAFLAGTVILRDSGDCAEGVTVEIKHLDGGNVGEAITNNYGDFRIDKLEPGDYVIRLQAPGRLPVETVVAVADDGTSLSPIALEPV
jgi:Fe-S-cluster-containing dehydrogenase component